MPGTTRVEIRTLKVGRYCCVDEKAYKINSISKSKPGKHGSAKARLELVDIFEYILRRVDRTYDGIYDIVSKLDVLSLEKKRQLTIPLIKEIL